VVLLHLVTTWASKRKAPPIKALHVHHGLQPAADSFAEHCERLCADWHIPFQLLKTEVPRVKGESLEAAAREKRYQALSAASPTGSALLLGHHAHDQAENFLIRALRGSGLRGMAGMQNQRAHEDIVLVRPLLTYSRDDIIEYANKHGLQWLEDPTNASPAFARNFLRNEILPMLTPHFPKAVSTLSRTAAHLQEAQSFIDRQTEAAFYPITQNNTFDLQLWNQLDPFLQKCVLQKWIETQTSLIPSTLCLRTIQEEVIQAAPDRHPEFHWNGWLFKRIKNKLLECRNG